MNSGMFEVVPGSAVKRVLRDRRAVMKVVRNAYALHRAGASVLPNSVFLRFRERPRDRIIALPCRLDEGTFDVSGIKWVASFPGNLGLGVPRGSAVIVLNDMTTGRAFACLEGAQISAARTAASAVVCLEAMQHRRSSGDSGLAFFGAGVIARTVARYIRDTCLDFNRVVICEPNVDRAAAFVAYVKNLGWSCVRCTSDEALSCGTVVTATTATAPHIDRAPNAGQVFLNISLRDFTPEAVLGSDSIVDDVDHCLREKTSPHLAAEITGNHNFIVGTIPELLAGCVELSEDHGVIISPFGLGVLDLAVATWVYSEVQRLGNGITIADFYVG